MKNLRKLGEKLLVKLWGNFCDLIEIIMITYGVALGYTRNVKRSVIPILSAIASAITALVVAIVVFTNSFIRTGCLYAFFSVEKHVAIMLASDKGDWSHWMTGGVYSVFKGLKEELLSENSFAQFLSGLNGNLFTKVIQIAILFACVACFIGLIVLLCKCIKNTFNSTVDYIDYRNHRKNCKNRKCTHINDNRDNVVQFPNKKIG